MEDEERQALDRLLDEKDDEEVESDRSRSPHFASPQSSSRVLELPAHCAYLLTTILFLSFALFVYLIPKPVAIVHMQGPIQLRIGTFNIRYDGKASEPVPIPSSLHSHSFPAEHIREGKKARPSKRLSGETVKTNWGPWDERPWSDRRWRVADSVLWEDLDVVGFQEVLENQVKDLQVLLGVQYGHVGVGRDDGKKAGEYAPIYYKKDRLELLSVQYFWLSETPSVPGSVSWDAGQTRMVTVARFRDVYINTDNEFYVLNTHWDDRGIQARAESAKVILKQVQKLLKGSEEPPLVILLGDLNSPSEEEGYRGLTGYRYTTREAPAHFEVTASHLTVFRDTRHELNRAIPHATDANGGPLLHSPFGELNTFTGFSPGAAKNVIDFIMVLDNGRVRTVTGSPEPAGKGPEWRVNRFGVVPNRFEDGDGGMLVSDHRLVVAALERIVV